MFFSPKYYLTCGMEDLSPLEPLCWISFPVYLCLGSEFPRLCWLNLKQIALPSIQCIWKWNKYLVKSPFMKRSVSEHTWMQGKLNEIGFESHWNEYLKTFLKSSVFKHTWMHEASIIKIRVINTWTKAMENQRPKKQWFLKVISKDCWSHLYLIWIVSICQGE